MSECLSLEATLEHKRDVYDADIFNIRFYFIFHSNDMNRVADFFYKN